MQVQLAGIHDRRSCFELASYTGIAAFQQGKGQDGIFPLPGTAAAVSRDARLSTDGMMSD